MQNNLDLSKTKIIYISETLDLLNKTLSNDLMDKFDNNQDYDFPQPEPKYFKVSPFELIPQKRYLVF